jgi:roadblock/LC7 domain-containing protein
VRLTAGTYTQIKRACEPIAAVCDARTVRNSSGRQQGWMYAGGDMTVAIGGNKGVFIKTARADFNQLFKVLVG